MTTELPTTCGAAVRSSDLLACAVQLLKVAVCPNCDGSGGIAVQTGSRQLVTREMAMDAGNPEMEGSLYLDDEWEQHPCQWCDEKAQVVSAYEAQANVRTERQPPSQAAADTQKL